MAPNKSVTITFPVQRERRLHVQMMLASMACCGAVTISNPFELIKTRLQLQGELQRSGYEKVYRGVFHAFGLILKNEGLTGIQRGLLLAYPYTVLMNGTRLGLYDKVKSNVAALTGFQSTNFLVGMISGATTGVLGSLIGNPFYVAKTRMQSSSTFLPQVGQEQHHYENSFRALVSIYKDEGVTGYFRGIQAACLRIMVASSVQLATYDRVKMALGNAGVPPGFGQYLASSVVSSVVMAVALNPFDVILTRLQNQKQNHYSGWFDCASKIVRTEGGLAFWKGLVPHFGRLCPHTIMIFLLFEGLKSVADRYEIY